MRKPVAVADGSEPSNTGGDPLAALLSAPVEAHAESARQTTIGTLLALVDDGATPLVSYPGQPGTAALRALTTIDLHAAHVGRSAVLLFENGDPTKPIVVGCVREAVSVADAMPGNLELDADGERMLVTAKEQLVLRCGRASITLTKSGKVLIEGAYVSNRSSGVLRLKGGSVEIN
jgi:hypothetical protein